MSSKGCFDTAFFILMTLVVMLTSTCGGGGGGSGGGGGDSQVPPTPDCFSNKPYKTQECDEFIVRLDTVYKNNSAYTLASTPNWWPLAANDTLRTDYAGEAELNFSSCYPQPLYLFGNSQSSFHVATCGKQEFGSGNNQCLEYGSTYNSCPGEITVYTANAKIVKNGTAYDVVYIPERDLTLLVVADGDTFLLPVMPGTSEYGEAIAVSGGNFAFVTSTGPVGGLDAGVSYPLTELPRIIPELNIKDWMLNLRTKAELDNVLPSNWPENLDVIPDSSFKNYEILFQGGLLYDPLIQDAILYSVDWKQAFQSQANYELSAVVNNQTVNVLKTYIPNPDLANANLERSGNPGGGFEIILIYPQEDAVLAEVSKYVVEALQGRGIKVRLEPVPYVDAQTIAATRAAAGEPIMLISYNVMN